MRGYFVCKKPYCHMAKRHIICVFVVRKPEHARPRGFGTARLRAETLDSGGFDSGRVLILSGGILRPMGDCPESASQQIIVGII